MSTQYFGEQYPVAKTSLSPYDAVGVILMSFPFDGLASGSGVLISPNIVLTCAHNVIDQKNTKNFAEQISFSPGYSGKNMPPPEKQHICEAAIYAKEFTNRKTQWDIALLKLAKGVYSTGFYFEPAEVKSDRISINDVNLVGYPGSKNYQMYESTNPVAQVDIENSLLILTHDTEPGYSGSPIYVSKGTGRGFSQFGIHVRGPKDGKGLRLSVLFTPQIYAWIMKAKQQLENNSFEQFEVLGLS